MFIIQELNSLLSVLVKKEEMRPQEKKPQLISPFLAFRGRLHFARHISTAGVETMKDSFTTEDIKVGVSIAEVIPIKSSEVSKEEKDMIPIQVLAALGISREDLDKPETEMFTTVSGNHSLEAIRKLVVEESNPALYGYGFQANVVVLTPMQPLNRLLYEGQDNKIRDSHVSYVIMFMYYA